MHQLAVLVLTETSHGSALDWMLRAFGVAAIVWAFFKGIQSLVTKPTAPPRIPDLGASHLPQPTPAAPPSVPAPTLPPAPTAPEEISAEMIAIIAAAVATVTDSSRRIVEIKSHNSLWEKAGRQSVLTSHRIR